MKPRITWPDGRKFAFTIFDNTDYATMDNVPEVYAVLSDLGFKTTKSVWVADNGGQALQKGATCEDPDYLEWVKRLDEQGFEIGYHLASYTSSTRGQTIQALDQFKKLFGSYPRVMTNQQGCRENLYWGDARLSGMNRLTYNVLTALQFHNRFQGHIEGSDYFWGDVCRERIDYVRNFVYDDLNTLKIVPFMPYHDPHRPFVNWWFAASEGPEKPSFLDLLREENQEWLEEEGGAAIVHTHFACGFYHDGEVDGRFIKLMERLAARDGWFVPVSTLLDYLRQEQGDHEITNDERTQLEKLWLRHKMMIGRDGVR